MTSTVTNPLVSNRAPAWYSKRTGMTHMPTTRADITNDSDGLTSIYPGEFTYKLDPTLEVELAIWEDMDHAKSIQIYYHMTGPHEGYQVCRAEEWEVAERINLAWQKDDSGRLTLQGKSKNTLVMMWRTGQKHDEAEARRLRVSDEIQKSAEEKLAELGKDVEKLGGQMRIKEEYEDPEQADLPVMKQRGRPSKVRT